jgi:hypothetical protein
MSYRLLLVALISLGLSAGLLPADAQKGGHGEGSWEVLKAPVSLPELPTYTGQQPRFGGGLIYPDKEGGPSIGMRFSLKEDPDTVSGWYREVLKSYKWTIMPSSNRDLNITAISNKGSTCTITINASAQAGYRTNLNINYQDRSNAN